MHHSTNRVDVFRTRVERDLVEHGIAHIADPITSDEYRTLGEMLGNVVAATRIALAPGQKNYVSNPGAIPLHTDHPKVDIVAWHCEEPDETSGASLLFDTRPFIERLDANHRAELHRINLATTALVSGVAMRWPVLRKVPIGTAVFWLPWLRVVASWATQTLAIEHFRESLLQAIVANHDSIRLAHSSALFIDNSRVLHGRDSLPPNSKRRLQRLWLSRRSA